MSERLQKESEQTNKGNYQTNFCFFMGGKNWETKRKPLKGREPWLTQFAIIYDLKTEIKLSLNKLKWNKTEGDIIPC